MAASSLEALAKAARGIDRLVVRGVTDPTSMREILWGRFRRDVAPWAELDYEQDVVGVRLLAAVKATPAAERPAVLFASNPALFDEAGLTQPVDPPAEPFPPGWMDPAGRWVPLYVQPVVGIYNHYATLPPRSWADLAADRFRDRLTFEEPWRMLATGPALAELQSVMGEGPWGDWLAALDAQRPWLVVDNERAVLEVGTGARWVGLSNWNVAKRVRRDSPVRHVFFDPTPCVPGFGMLSRDNPGEPLGRLFLAWLSSPDGQRGYAATGRIPALASVDAKPSLKAVLPPGVRPLFGSVGWLSDPGDWSARFRAAFPTAGPTPEGKMR
jgi:ABC-type Fe3+ transport system substrate-binding protein